MANTIVTSTYVTREVARYFSNNLKGASNFNRSYDSQYSQGGAKVGNTVKARLPQKWEVRDGQAYSQQNLLDETVDIVLNHQKGVDFGWSSSQATTDLDEIKTRYIQPAAETLANSADSVAMEDVYKDIYNSVGVLGTTPATALLWLQAGVKLDDGASMENGRCAVLDPLACATLSNAQQALFHPGPAISENNRTGQFARNQLGVDDWYRDNNVPRFTSGDLDSGNNTPLVNGAGQTGSSLITDGWDAGAAPVKGDIFTLAGVNQVNPLSKVDTGRLQQFVVTATPTAGASITFSISPSIITSGPLQTVTASPANNAVLTIWNMTAGSTLAPTTSPQSLLFHKDFAAFVMADLVMPNGGARATRVNSKQMGISIRFVEQFDIATDQNQNRLDILFGSATLQARLACRVVG